MDNKVLLILLRKYERELQSVFEEIQEEIPTEMKEKYKDLLGHQHERAPILKPLRKFMEGLIEDIEILENETD